ncbi:hypothetical protein ACQRBK_08385 [Peptoniphilaceae bacterium SGI.137]|nr:hypothetical protein [Peptoniphilaceae bacterium]MDY5765916.1 hypothetical protein [Peptoniphilaceae bacterium]MDY6146195.1 hypothetical protein [Peptoniphilaceae bacterium]
MRKKQKKKPDDRLMKIAIVTAMLSLAEKIIELIIELLKMIEGN